MKSWTRDLLLEYSFRIKSNALDKRIKLLFKKLCRMIQIKDLQNYYPPLVRDDPNFKRYMLKEYIQLLILDYLSATAWIKKITLIGGTCLRLLKGIDRFSEDIDFDCKDLSKEEFLRMTDDIIRLLLRNGFNVEPRDKESTAKAAVGPFPGLLFDQG
ncbi:MAG: nucleotidyl transferase AbiEii/AbiGii toxin family protein [Bacteroidales bacterium]|nr:nucleotidyl transferase AbiEii/AbiGii toxin family protein [Bacteroidales bacterium]